MTDSKEMNHENDTIKEQLENTNEEVQNIDIELVEESVSDEFNIENAYKESQDNYLRLLAEFDNFKKRTARERIEYAKTAGQDIISSILPVIDDFERAIQSFENAKEITAIKEGVELIYKKLKNTLHEKGLEEIKSIGEAFNPDIHEAITQIPAAEESMKGKVMDEVEKGYTLGGKVIRHPKVVVGQ